MAYVPGALPTNATSVGIEPGHDAVEEGCEATNLQYMV
jgi:hypothetical protein